VGCVFVLIGVTAGTEPGDAAAEDINEHVPCSFGLCDQELSSSVGSLDPPTPIPWSALPRSGPSGRPPARRLAKTRSATSRTSEAGFQGSPC